MIIWKLLSYTVITYSIVLICVPFGKNGSCQCQVAVKDINELNHLEFVMNLFKGVLFSGDESLKVKKPNGRFL